MKLLLSILFISFSFTQELTVNHINHIKGEILDDISTTKKSNFFLDGYSAEGTEAIAYYNDSLLSFIELIHWTYPKSRTVS